MRRGQSDDQCLTDAQIKAVDTLHATYKFPFPLANGLDDYPGWGVSGEDTPSFGPTGGWTAWWLGTAPPAQPPTPNNGIAWVYGAGGIQYIFARDPNLDVTTYKPEDHKARVLEVSQLMDSTNPDLSRFRAQGGRLIVLEHMADYAQSPYAGIRYFENVERKLGKAETAEFARLYTAPGVDHVGSGAPANVDMLSVLVDWVEKGHAPGISKSRSRRSKRLRSPSSGRCRCADGRPGRTTSRALRLPRRAILARREAVAKFTRLSPFAKWRGLLELRREQEFAPQRSSGGRHPTGSWTLHRRLSEAKSTSLP